MKGNRRRKKSTRNGCHLVEVDHCGDAEQFQPTNISIKPAVLSQSHMNGTLGRKGELGEKKKKGHLSLHYKLKRKKNPF